MACESYFGDCCEGCPDPQGAIDHFDIRISEFDAIDIYGIYMAWANPAGRTLLTRDPDRNPDGRAPLKPGRWNWTLTTAGATIDSRSDDVWFTSLDSFAYFAGESEYFSSGHFTDRETVNGLKTGQFLIPCGETFGGIIYPFPPVFALLYFQRQRSGPVPAGFSIEATAIWVSDPP